MRANTVIIASVVGSPSIEALDSDEGGVLVLYEERVYRPMGPTTLVALLVAHVTSIEDGEVEVRVPGYPVETWRRSPLGPLRGSCS